MEYLQSYMTAGDKGAIFYTFPGGNVAPYWNDAARAQALAYCDECLAIARGRAESTIGDDSTCPECGRDYADSEEEEPHAGPGDCCPVCAEDVAELQKLRAYIVAGATSFESPPTPRYSLQELEWMKEDAEEEGHTLRAYSFTLTRDVTESQSVVAFGVTKEDAEDSARSIAEARPEAWAVDDCNMWDSPYANDSAEEESFPEEWAAAMEEARRAEGGRA